MAAWPGFLSQHPEFHTWGELLAVLCAGTDFRFSCTSVLISSTSQRVWNAATASPRKLRCDIVFQGHVLRA